MFKNLYKNKKVLITGHTGFKGSWLTLWLTRLGAKVIGISIDVPTEPSLFNDLKLANKIVDYRCDIRNFDEIKKIIIKEKPDFIFHMAAQPIVSESYIDPIYTLTTNINGTINVLESIRYLDKKCIAIIVTSDKCYENIETIWGYKETDTLGGKDIYSASKGAAEIVFRSFYNSFFKDSNKHFIVSARAGNVIGGGDWAKNRIIPDTIKSWRNNKPVAIRSPKSTRPWQHVLEPLSGYLTLGYMLFLDPNLNGQSFNFGPNSENNFTVEKLLKDLSTSWHFKNKLKIFKTLKNTSFHEAGLLKLNCEKSSILLNWKPTLTFSELIKFTGNWYFNFYLNKFDAYKYTCMQIDTYEKKAKINDIEWSLS